MSTRAERVRALQKSVTEYVKAEKTRITNEVASLEAVLKGRTSGAGIQKVNVKVVEAAAGNDLSDFLRR